MEIRGKWETCQVWVGERELRPGRSQRVRNHSPDGFNWGYGGSGPAQLTLALLLELTTADMALLWYQEVKWRIIVRLPQADFILDSQDLLSCITSAVSAALVQGEGGRVTPEEQGRAAGAVARSTT
jgi:uncharacterized protein DUF6166